MLEYNSFISALINTKRGMESNAHLKYRVSFVPVVKGCGEKQGRSYEGWIWWMAQWINSPLTFHCHPPYFRPFLKTVRQYCTLNKLKEKPSKIIHWNCLKLSSSRFQFSKIQINNNSYNVNIKNSLTIKNEFSCLN